ncbi:MAG TPA: SpoIIE family protein phosphatase [Solirubrobacteraceae bacterium]|nr:SpoIIE family protein phosphatase [Solirubrobacteraceae bacterium]
MIDDDLLEDAAEDLFEDAPCGYLSTRLDGTIVKVNRTFESWTGRDRGELLGRVRFQELLAPGARIYHETHYAPLLRMQGEVRGIAVEILRADGERLPALVNSVLRKDDDGRPQVIRTTVFDASDRRRYEQELLRARRREQEIARELQRGMLSGALPEAEGLDVGVAYRPGVAGLEVGGDWYDAFWLDDGETIGLVVGDVVGRGIGAAATMGQLRSAVRALASTGLGPAALVTALDGYARRHRVGRMTTLVYAQLQLGTRRLRYAVAGHPPPLLVMPGEDPCFVWDGRSLPLDAHRVSAERARDEAVRVLAPGSAILLYTDGLVESRSRPLDEGMDCLLHEVAARRDDPIAGLVAAVVRALHDAEHIDDVCLLAARVGGGAPL